MFGPGGLLLALVMQSFLLAMEPLNFTLEDTLRAEDKAMFELLNRTISWGWQLKSFR